MANNVTKVTERGRAGRRNMASRHSIPQRICAGEGDGRDRRDEENVTDKVKAQRIKQEARGAKRNKRSDTTGEG